MAYMAPTMMSGIHTGDQAAPRVVRSHAYIHVDQRNSRSGTYVVAHSKKSIGGVTLDGACHQRNRHYWSRTGNRRTVSSTRWPLAFFVAVLISIAVLVFGPVQARSALQTSTMSYIVQPGDTLWSYAEDITPKGGDVRDTVDDLIAMNGLDDMTLHAGQKIIVPVE